MLKSYKSGLKKTYMSCVCIHGCAQHRILQVTLVQQIMNIGGMVCIGIALTNTQLYKCPHEHQIKKFYKMETSKIKQNAIIFFHGKNLKQLHNNRNNEYRDTYTSLCTYKID